ncbi:MAG: VapC toxin family PIN domain ribonuclease [Comamonadaceae bacterium CG_4_9_14_3_um_filter_60_33]|nr:MAG: VapC toxin family PIN domain ribonuclease [Comamonadaceae bacterium CG2_30_59_20]PIY29754.1 MAG: VapC toxin family PIN domain ribonuclease [Comamonadaceae bacterium CG_4_10_14_3_um_filter_60_42]PJB44109.1 MAG: VapC toxin family PIN domain ribonuclease [Comamonadaceae bacterium CG_4_9_14_3_um_filter_60_33]
MNVLVDSSVWVDHFKQKNDQLATLLRDHLVVCHPYIVMEVACGTPPNRRAIIEMLGELESTTLATTNEILSMLAGFRLYGRGCGLVDLSLFASVLLTDKVLLWTFDKRLEQVASERNKAYRPLLQS